MRQFDSSVGCLASGSAGVQARVWVPAQCFFSREDAQRHCWLWLLGSDGQVRALLAPAHHLDYDDLLPDLLRQFGSDDAVSSTTPAVDATVALPNAPIVPLPRWSVSWGHPLQRGIRAFAQALDREVVEALGDLEVQGACFGTVRNYNRLVRVPAPVRARRLQALALFPAWLAPVLLEPVERPQMFADRDDDNDRYRRHAPVPLHGLLASRRGRGMPPQALNALLDVIDQGRDLIDAIAHFYRVDRALVRAPLGREPWQRGAMPEAVVSLLQALPAHARPRQRKEVEPRLAAIQALPVHLRSPADVSRLAAAFKRGWNCVWKTCEREHPNLPQAIRDCRDLLNAALASLRQPPEQIELDVDRLGLAWIARKGIAALLEASRHWHGLPMVQLLLTPIPAAIPADAPLVPLFGELDVAEGHARELLTADALYMEGETMAHCVADYWHQCQRGGIRIVHLETVAGEAATLQLGFDIHGYNIEIHNLQLRSRYNAAPSPAVCELAEAVLLRLAELGDAVHGQMTLIAAQARAFRVQEDAQRQPPPPPRRQLDARLRTQLAQVLTYAQAQDDWRLPIHRPLRVTVAGFQYGQGEDVLDDLQIGDVLRLVREPDNLHDQRAVRIEWNRKKLGYVPRAENAALAQALDRGAAASARVHALLDNDWAPVEIEIELEG